MTNSNEPLIRTDGASAFQDGAMSSVLELMTSAHTEKERASDEVDNSICHMWNLDRYDSDV